MNTQTKEKLTILLIKISNSIIQKVQIKYPQYRFNIIQKDIDIIFKYYETLKTDTKKIISTKEFKQDRHKIASVFVFSILSVPFVLIDQTPKNITREEAQKWISYQIAIIFASQIIFSFNNKGLNFKYPPKTTNGKSYKEYLNGLIHSMNENITHNSKDNPKIANYINSLSNIFFLLEYITISNHSL